MSTAQVRGELPASAARVWERIRDFSDASAWAPEGMTVARSEGSGVGALRWIESENGSFLERCESFDPERRTFSYAIVEGPPMMKRYLVQVSVEPLGADRCAIAWTCEFELEGVPERAAVEMVEGGYASFLAVLERTMTASSA